MDNEMIKEAIEIITKYTSSRMCSGCILHEICRGHWKECPEYWNIDFVEDEEDA